MACFSVRTGHQVRAALVINTTGIVIAKTWIAVGYDRRPWLLLLARSPARLLLLPISIRYGLRIGVLVLVCAACLIDTLLFFLKRFRFLQGVSESTACGGLIVVFRLAAGPLIDGRLGRSNPSLLCGRCLWLLHGAAHLFPELRLVGSLALLHQVFL